MTADALKQGIADMVNQILEEAIVQGRSPGFGNWPQPPVVSVERVGTLEFMIRAKPGTGMPRYFLLKLSEPL